MFLAKPKLPSGTKKISNMLHALESPYLAMIQALSQVQYAISGPTGGRVKITYGDFVFYQAMFDDDWPPPKHFDIDFGFTMSTEAAAIWPYSGSMRREGLGKMVVPYEFYPTNNFTTMVTAGTSFNDTLVNVVMWACNAARLNLTPVTTLARATSPQLVYTVPSDILLVDLLEKMCKYHTHFFEIDESTGTLTLVDMFASNGTQTLTEYDIFPPNYPTPAAVKEISDGKQGGVRVQTSETNGSVLTLEPFESNTTNITTAFNLAKILVERDQVVVAVPLDDVLPVMGKQSGFINTTGVRHPLDVTLYTRKIDFDFSFGKRGKAVLSGDGTLAGVA